MTGCVRVTATSPSPTSGVLLRSRLAIANPRRNFTVASGKYNSTWPTGGSGGCCCKHAERGPRRARKIVPANGCNHTRPPTGPSVSVRATCSLLFMGERPSIQPCVVHMYTRVRTIGGHFPYLLIPYERRRLAIAAAAGRYCLKTGRIVPDHDTRAFRMHMATSGPRARLGKHTGPRSAVTSSNRKCPVRIRKCALAFEERAITRAGPLRVVTAFSS